MPVFTQAVVNNRVLITVFVSDPSQPANVRRTYVALVDTGATMSMISERVVREAGAVSTNSKPFLAANGQHTMTPTYTLDISVPVFAGSRIDGSQETQRLQDRGGVRETFLMPPVQQGAPERGFDVILGMDILRMFMITMHEDRFTMAF